MTIAELLQEARDLITPREKWIKGERNDGHGAYCAIGAIHRIARKHDLNYGPRIEAQHALRDVIGGSIADYNDSHDHTCILVAFDAAIEKTKETT